MRKTLTGLVAAAAIGAAGLGLTGAAQAQDYPSVTLRLAHPLPEVWPGVQWDKWWAEEVTKRSGGKIQIEIFWAGQLGNLLEIKGLVESGAVDLGVFAQAVHASEMKLTSICGGLLNRVSATPEVAHELTGQCYGTEPVQAELASLNLHPIKWTVTSPYRFLCNSEIETMADLQGKKIRAVGGAYVPIWMETYGIVPTRIQSTEIREGLERGTLDCNFGPIEWVPIFGLQKAAPYISDINTGTFTTFQLYAPKATWDSWPDSVRDLMTEVALEAMRKELEWLPGEEKKAYGTFEEAGGKIVKLSDMEAFATKSPDMIDVWVKNMTEEGLGEAIEPIVPLQRKAAESFKQ